MAVFDVQRVLSALQKLDRQTAAIAQSMAVIESSVSASLDLTDLVANTSFLPSPGDFSNTEFTANTIFNGDVEGPDTSNTFLVTANCEAYTTTSYGFPVGNTASEYNITLTVDDNANTPITFWLSTQPGGTSIAQNAYVTDRSQAINVTSNTTIKFEIGDSTGIITTNNHVYTHSYLLEEQTYYLNFTYNTFGNFNGRIMVVDFTVPHGIFETQLTISGVKVS